MDKKVIPLKHVFVRHMLLFARDLAKIIEFHFGLLRTVRAIAWYGVHFAQKALKDLEVWVLFFLFIWNLKIVLRVFKGLQRSFDDIRVAYSLVNTNKKKNNCNLIPRFIPN